MKVIVIDRKGSRAVSLQFNSFSRRLLGAGLALFPLLVGFAAYGVAKMASPDGLAEQVALWHQQLSEQEAELENINTSAQQNIDALAVRMSELQARLMRLDALGERMVEAAKLDKGEFDFSQRAAIGGGADAGEGKPYAVPALSDSIDRLQALIEERERQLAVLDNLLADRKLSSEASVSGWPVEKGWISSGFGLRDDPFNGHQKMHQGVDFSSREGADVVSVASGVVTWAGEKEGYGLSVEINHGGGYMTRYAHNQENMVAVGDIVKKGQDIALVGNSGRSTGPHLHFEVYKHGRIVDPASYIRRNKS